MESDKEEQDYSGDSLNQIEPVARIWIREIVGPCFPGDYQTIDGVIDERYKDAAYLDEKDVGYRLEILYGVIKIRRSGQSFGIGIKMFEKKKTEWDNSGKLMQLAQDKRPAQTYSQVSPPLPPASNLVVIEISSGRL